MLWGCVLAKKTKWGTRVDKKKRPLLLSLFLQKKMSMMNAGHYYTTCLLGLFLLATPANGFSTIRLNIHSGKVSPSTSLLKASSGTATAAAASKGFGAVVEKTEKETKKGPKDSRPVAEIKQELLDLLPKMTGQEEEFRKVESLVNALEEQYMPAQTLGFLNMAMAGEWQLLFSTNLAGGGNPAKFRLRELFQRIETNNLEGTITNQALWDLAEDEDGIFDATGTFAAVCSYKINQGARMVVDLDEHILKPTTGSKIPKDVPELVGRLHKAMPKEMFDPQDHAIDTTYLDADMRIVRMTGPRLEGVRDIFIRRGSMEIDPTTAASNN
jgi:hypothetical protein